MMRRRPLCLTILSAVSLLSALAAGVERAAAEEVTVTVPSSSSSDVTVTVPPSGGPAAAPLPPVVVPPAGDTPAAAPAEKPKKKPASAPAKKAQPTKSAAIDPERSGSGTTGKVKGSGQSIAVLVNDEPITGYEIVQRQRMLGNNANVNNQAQANFKAMIKSPKTSEKLKAILNETIKANPGKSRDKIIDIFERRKKEFAMGLQKQAVDGARNNIAPGLKKDALEELIDERLKLQEAKRLSVVVGEEDVDRIMKSLAEKNKMSEAEFAKYIKGGGGDINLLRARFKANLSWNEVVRRRFGSQVAVTERDVDRLVEKSPSTDADSFELQVQRITLPIPAKIDQKVLAQRLAEAEAIASRGGGCAGMAGNATAVPGAKFETLGSKPANSFAEPTRSLLLNAKDDELLPPSVAAGGIEIWAVCKRKELKADLERRQSAQSELRQKEFEVLAKKHLKDLRQDASIEYR